MTKVIALKEPKGVQRFGVEKPEGMEFDFIEWPCSDEELKEALKDADILWTGPVDFIRKDVIDSAKNLKLIQSLGVGFDKIDLEAAKANGVYVCNNRAVNAKSVAEHAVGLMLACLKKTAPNDARIKNGEFDKCFAEFKANGHKELGTRTVGLVGLGAIGKEACKYLKAFGSKVLYYDVVKADEAFEKEYDLKYCTLDELYEQCDILSYHVPVLDSTRGMVNKAAIAKMKKDNLKNTQSVSADGSAALFSRQIFFLFLNYLFHCRPARCANGIAHFHTGFHADGIINVFLKDR